MARPRVPLDVLQQLIRRSEGRCERCWRYVVDPDAPMDELVGRGERWSVQHRQAAGMGGTTDAAFNSPWNVVLLCGNGTMGCHGEIEGRQVPREDGWWVSKWTHPRRVPIRLGGGRLVTLTDDWSYADVPEE